MNGVTRFLSRRDKRSISKRRKSRIVATDIYGVLTLDESKKGDKEEDAKIKSILKQLQAAGITALKEPQVEYALRSKYAKGDPEKAMELLTLFEDSVEGVLRDIEPNTELLGAVNRESVTCYLDSLLFGMFARLDSFEGMLFYEADDEPRRRLAALLRFWVNMMRTGKLITTDITRHIQDALADCGWEDARELEQQDTSEAFTFITGKLELPLLTLKMDIYHTGKEDIKDDHKLVNERLLDVAIPTEVPEGGVITLEDCLESYFNNKIEVKRHLQRQNTIKSSTDPEKGEISHIETLEVGSDANTPIITPTTQQPSLTWPRRPLTGRHRTDSIFNERRISVALEASEKKEQEETAQRAGRPRGISIRKEVLMPAWQFFSLIPWYTDSAPMNDAQVADHFSSKRPVLGICLKRYSMLPDGTPTRLNTYIDIPLEIGLPHFISDNRNEDDGPLFGNFKLSLQSVICHRGVSVNSGHYVCLVRGRLGGGGNNSRGITPDPQASSQWMRFDDLAEQRVTAVDIHRALHEESPYLVFYQVQPIDDHGSDQLPTYEEANSTLPTMPPSTEALFTETSPTFHTILPDGHVTDTVDWDQNGTTDVSEIDKEEKRGRASMSSNRPNSVSYDDSSISGISKPNTAPTTPAEEGKGFFLSASRRGSLAGLRKMSKSRPSSQSGEGRLSLTMSRLTGRMSKDKLAVASEVGVSDSDFSGVVTTDSSKSEDSSNGNTKTKPVEPALNSQDTPSKSKKSKKSKEHKRMRSLSKQSPEEKDGNLDRQCMLM